MNGRTFCTGVLLAAAAIWPSLAAAQSTDAATMPADYDRLMGLGNSDLKGELTSRYDAAVTATTDSAVVAADNKRYVWASQAKAQCGIALGYLKSGEKDPVSIGKCVDAHDRLQEVALSAPVAPAAPEAPQVACNKGPFILFFDWNSSDITAEAVTTLDSLTATYPGCGGAAVTVSGYADRSGTDRYNQALSERRAETVKQFLAGRSIPDSSVTARGFGETSPRVPTADGVRELQNRRVEITVQ